MIEAKIIKDSTSWLGVRLTSMILTYPRCIHSELMTHRVFSRNSASSRAIPHNTLKKSIEDNFYYPTWTLNQKGMQGKVVDDLKILDKANKNWLELYEIVSDKLNSLSELNIHKQNINRALESFQYIKVLVTSTEWSNFLLLRNHKDAQPEIQELASIIERELRLNEPEYIGVGGWHLPFELNVHRALDIQKYTFYTKSLEEIQLISSVAKCARVSYNKFDDIDDFNQDLELYNKLTGSSPMHLSPTEHQAKVPTEAELDGFNCYYTKKYNNGDPKYIYSKGVYNSNLEGWIQYRKLLEHGV